MVLYANDEELLRLRDDEFGSGGVGISTGTATPKRASADVLFDNFVVGGADRTILSASESSDPSPTEGKVIKEDDFSDPASGWNSSSKELVKIEYTGGAYQISSPATAWSSAEHLGNFADVSIEVNGTQLEGPENGGLGITCRGTDEKGAEYHYYVFYVTSDGTTGIGRRRPNGALENLAVGRNVGPVKAGSGETNHLRADCVGQRLTLTINGEKLLEVEDDTISTAGRVGFEVGGGTRDKPVIVQFDNFVLREP